MRLVIIALLLCCFSYGNNSDASSNVHKKIQNTNNPILIPVGRYGTWDMTKSAKFKVESSEAQSSKKIEKLYKLEKNSYKKFVIYNPTNIFSACTIYPEFSAFLLKDGLVIEELYFGQDFTPESNPSDYTIKIIAKSFECLSFSYSLMAEGI